MLTKENTILRSNGFFLTKSFTVEPVDKKYHTRPEGKHLNLNGRAKDIEIILGIRPSVEDQKILFTEFVNKVNNSSNVTDCFHEPNLKINKRICGWCQRNVECSLLEEGSSTKSMEYQVFEKKGSKSGNDISILESYFQNRDYHVRSKIPLYTDKMDPFKPNLTNKGSRIMILLNINDINYGKEQELGSWSHIFFSRYLFRTLSTFEAILLNSYVFAATDEVKLDALFKKAELIETLPTVKDIKDFFSDLFPGPYQFNATKAQIKYSLTNKNLLEDRLSNIKEEFHFMTEAYNNTKRFFHFGFFDINLELFTCYQPGMTLDDCIVEFFFEVQSYLQPLFAKDNVNLDSSFFESRKKCIIYSNVGNVGVDLPINYQVVRVEINENLTNSWVLVEDISDQIIFSGIKSKKKINIHWIDTKFEPTERLLFKLSNQYRGKNLAIWPNVDKTNSPEFGNLIIFNPIDIFSLMSVNLVGKSNNFSTGDSISESRRESFWHLISSVFFGNLRYKTLDEKKELKTDKRDKLIKFKEIFQHPKFRRFMPFNLIENVHSEYPESHDFIEYMKYETPGFEREIIHRLVIRSPGYVFRGENYEDLEWVFERTESRDEENRVQLSLWENVSVKGWEFELNHQRKIKNFVELINHTDVRKSLFFQDNQYVLLSPKVIELLNQEDKDSHRFENYFINRTNQDGQSSALIFTFYSELSQLENLIGKVDFLNSNIEIKGDEIILVLPKIAVSESSPNFLPLKIN